MTLSRRQFLSLGALTASAAILAACSTGSTQDTSTTSNSTGTSTSSSFPVTLTHAFGTTTIESEPKRVAAIGWINGDIAAALGVIPVAQAKITWGGNADGSLDWFDAKVKELGATAPTRFDETDGLNFTALAEARPDVILAVVGNLSQEDYDKLSKIAPVVTYQPDGSNWRTPWDEATLTIGQALGRSEQAQKVVTDLKNTFAAQADKHPELAGATFIAASLATTGDSKISLYGSHDVRSVFFQDLGLTLAPVVTSADFGDQFWTAWSPERASELQSDLIYSWVNSPADVDAITADPLLSKIPAIAHGGFLGVPDQTENMALGCSPLGMQWLFANTDFVDRVAAAVTAGKAGQ